MHIEDGLLTPFWMILGWVIVVPVLLAALRKADWHELQVHHKSWPFVFALIALVVVWSTRAGIYPGLNVHLLGAMIMTLMFGPSLALLGMASLVLLMTALGVGGWASLGVNLLVLSLVPVGTAYGILKVVEKYLPGHFFIYIFVVAFIGSALTIAATSAVITLVLLSSGAYAWHFLVDNWLISMVLGAWGEALTTGMLITMLVVYRPGLVRTFDDAHYIKGK